MSILKKTKDKSLKNIIRLSYSILIFIMIIPSLYSIITIQTHTKGYDNIITNVSNANQINKIAKIDIPNELWDIVCGRKNFDEGRQNAMLEEISIIISDMLLNTTNKETIEKLKVAQRTKTTLERNINGLGRQIATGASVKSNETSLDEIRTICALFSDIMEDYVVLEIESGNETNISIKQSSVILTIIQIVIMLFAFSISLYVYFEIFKSINKPISEMEKLSTKIAKGDLTARVSIPHIDELNTLAENLNTMTEQIDVLIKKNIAEQKNFQKAEMKALQAQIAPHFLYNTFDTIIWLAEDKDRTDDVVKITKAFSNFLRISLSRGHEWITIEEELDHIKNYLTIQKIRYRDILNYEIIADESLYDCKIIKLVLQPLVENAIYHGIKNKRGRGNLKVLVEWIQNKKSILITVEDDGAGFDKERLKQVQEEMKLGYENSEKLSSVYGLFNVHKKLKLYYGNKTEGLKIESEKNKGSKISFIIPYIKNKMETENV